MTRTIIIACATALLCTTASCYRLTPTDGGAPTVGRELVLQLSERGAIELAPKLGVQLRSVTGRVADFRNDAYEMAVTQTNSRSGVETLWRGEQASIPRAYVVQVAERRLDRRRTWLVAGISAVGVAIAGSAFGGSGFGDLFGGREGGTRQ